MKQLFSVLLVVASANVCAETVALAWGASTPTASVAGYELRYGQTAGANTTVVVDAGNVLTKTITGLEAGKTYYFRARAYNTGKTVFSPDSNEVSKVFVLVLTAPINLLIQ